MLGVHVQASRRAGGAEARFGCFGAIVCHKGEGAKLDIQLVQGCSIRHDHRCILARALCTSGTCRHGSWEGCFGRR